MDAQGPEYDYPNVGLGTMELTHAPMASYNYSLLIKRFVQKEFPWLA